MSLANKGRVKSAEHRKKLSDALTGRKRTEETRKKMSEARRKRWENWRAERILRLAESLPEAEYEALRKQLKTPT